MFKIVYFISVVVLSAWLIVDINSGNNILSSRDAAIAAATGG